MTETITYHNETYPILRVVIFKDTNEEMEVAISTTELERKLFQDFQQEKLQKMALKIDEAIAYYLEPDELSLPKEEIIQIVEASYL